MLLSILKNTIIFLTSFYLSEKVTKTFVLTIKDYAKSLVFSLVLSLVLLLLKIRFPHLSYFIPAFCFFILFSIKHKNWSLSIFCISLSAYVINLLIFDIVTFPCCSLFILIFKDLPLININIVTTIICILYPLFIYLSLRNRQVYKYISSIFFNGMININTLTCLLALVILTLERTSSQKYYQMRLFRLIMIFVCLILILYWWRTQITKTYREKLRLLEMKTLRAAKVENEAYISRLEAENKRLGTIIHKDNRIVNAMADSVCDYLSTASGSDLETLHSKGLSLSDEINSIKTYRQELLCEGSLVQTSIPQTNLAGVDAIITFMLKEASTHGITLQFHFDKEVFSSKHFTASEMDLVHLLSDLLQNAIIATRHAGGKTIELSLQSLKGTPAISVSDSGIPFEIDTYMKLGVSEASTHLEEGGTGIGLIDIWSFKKKYRASLVIEELDDSICTKRLSLLFDGKNKYLIVSNRFQQIISNQTRSDLLVISPVTNELVELIEE